MEKEEDRSCGMAGTGIELGRPPLLGSENPTGKRDGGSEFSAHGEGVIGRPSIDQDHFKLNPRLAFKAGKKSGYCRCLIVDGHDNGQLRNGVSCWKMLQDILLKNKKANRKVRLFVFNL